MNRDALSQPMQTQCPHCETQFRITEEQYQIADGLVRCGVCHETFHAVEINPEAQPPLEQTEDGLTTHDNLSDQQSQSEPTYRSPLNPVFPQSKRSTEYSNEAEAISSPAGAVLGTNDEPDDPFAHLASSSTTETPLHTLENEDDKNHRVAAASAFDDDKANTAQPDQHETGFDFFQTEPDETLSPDTDHSIVPEDCRTENSHAVLKGMLWSLAIVFLSLTLVAEYIWFNRNQLIQMPQTKPWVERLCQLTNCEIAALRAPDQIELVTRNIYSHPNQKNTLIVAVTLVNHASFAQPYPLMQIDFSNVRGSVVAARRFTPQTYLQTPTEQLRLLTPNATSSFTMMIQDPGDEAMTYEFNFL